MSPLPLSERIVEALRPRGSRILTVSDLARKVLGPGAADQETDGLRAAVTALEREGRVVRVRGEKVSLIEYTDFAAGVVALRGEGRAVLLSGEPGVPDLPIRSGRLGSALDGDVVLVRLETLKTAKGRAARPLPKTGAVVKVLLRRRETVVGKLVRGPEGAFIAPFDRKIDARLRVPDGKDLGAPEGIFVEARVLAWPDDRRLALAEVIETIGFEGEPGVDVEVVARKWGLPRHYPEEALREAAAASGVVGAAERAARADFTGRTIVTIDGETARDFDDAIEAEELPGGGVRVGVHIADVSHYVTPGSALDAEAFERGTSVYFPDRALAMLPERLSNDLCSLRPDEERRTVSAILTLDAKGETVRADFARSLIRSKARLTYTQVGEFLEGERPGIGPEGKEKHEGNREPPAGRSHGSETASRRAERALGTGQPEAGSPMSPAASAAAADQKNATSIEPDVASMLRVAQRAALLLRKKREARGSLDFDLPDADVILGETGDIVAIAKAVRNEAHRLIEELMIAANEAVAKHLLFVPMPAPYRVHDRPDESRLVDLRAVLGPLGYDIPEDEEEVRPAVFQAILDRAAGTPEERFVSDVVLRAQRKAIYAEECRGHYALAAPYYTHFTSPIRRYPDLLVHRALVEWLGRRRAPAAGEAEARTRGLRIACVQCSDRERRAESAEREAVAWKKFVYLRNRVGEEFEAWVTAVVGFGLFVTLDAIYVDGLVPVGSLGDDFYRYDDVGHQLVGSQFGRIYRLGDRLRVKLITADPDRRALDFAPAGESAGPRRRSRVERVDRRRGRRPAPRRR
jgi:ribonuclease R